jgi:hypothetical protein
MSRCRKCKYYREEQDYEYWIVHLLETHGLRMSDARKRMLEVFPNIKLDEELIQDIWKRHKDTGKAGADMFKAK